MLVLVLLPPSEGKASAGDGAPLDLASLSLPKLRSARRRVVDALVRLCRARDKAPALAALGLTERQRDEVARNAALRRAATLPAASLYTGVLFEALDLGSLSPEAWQRAEQSVLIFSGLWGAVRISDRLPPYRCAIGARLPEIGALSAHWRAALPASMASVAGGGPVLDLRSGAYAAAWSPPAGIAEATVTVRVVHERLVDGVAVRSVVSHFNKATKGRLARALLASGAQPSTAAELVEAIRALGYAVEEPTDPPPGQPRSVDLVVSAI